MDDSNSDVDGRGCAVFVQVMEGQVRDRVGLEQQMDRWERDLRPGATGFLGSTGGVDASGRAFMLARFEDSAAARANSDRPEQGAWWQDTEACFEGQVIFADSEEVDLFLGGGSDDAGFVQIMKDDGADRAQLRSLDRLFEQHGGDFRPDVLGGMRVWTGPDSYVEAAYFTSEAEARAGEQNEPPPQLADHVGEMQAAMAGVEFVDLSDPWLR